MSSLTSLIQSLGGGGDVTQWCGCGLQVPISIGNVSMAQIGAQCRHVLRDGLAVSRTPFERVDGERMAEIVDTATTEPRIPSQVGGTHQMEKGRVHGRV